MDLIFMLIPSEYQPVIVLVSIIGFFGSELLSTTSWFQANGWCQAIRNIFRAIVKKFRPELMPTETTATMNTTGQEVQNDVRGIEGTTEQRITSPTENAIRIDDP